MRKCQSSFCGSAAVRACGPHCWRLASPSTASRPDRAAPSPRGCGAAYPRPRCRPPRPNTTTRRPPFATSTQLACVVAVVAPKPDRAAPYPRGGGTAFLRLRRASLSARPRVGGAVVLPSLSLRPRPTTQCPTLVAKARLAGWRGLVAMAQPRRRRCRCAPVQLCSVQPSRRRRGLPAAASQFAVRATVAAAAAPSPSTTPRPDHATFCPRDGGAACPRPRRES